MTFWKTEHQPNQIQWRLESTVSRLKFTVVHTQWWQWIIAVVVGLVLALYLLVIIPWKPRWALFLALAALFPFVAIIFGDVRKFLLATILLETPLDLDIHLFYNPLAVYYNAIGGLSISITTFCLAILYALWGVELLTKATTRAGMFRASLPMLVYLTTAMLSMVVAQNVLLASFEVFVLFQSFLLLLYILKFVQGPQEILFVVTLLMIGLVFESLVMISLRVIGHNINIAQIKAGIDATGRVSGTLGSPNTAASYLTLLLAPTLGVLLSPLQRRYKLLAGLAFSLGTVALVLTFSRGGWVALIVSVTLLCLLALFRGWLSPRIPIILTIVLILLLLFFHEPILNRVFGDDLGAANSRTIMAKQALRVIDSNPVFGVGANNYAFWYEQHPAPEIDGPRLRTVHNKYFLVWAETGIIGLVAFLGFLFSVIRRGWQVGGFGDRLLSPLALGFTMSIVGQMAHMFVDIFHGRSQVQTLWLVAALIIAMRNMDASVE